MPLKDLKKREGLRYMPVLHMCHKLPQKPWHSCAAPLSRDAVSLNASQYIEYLEIDPFLTISQFGESSTLPLLVPPWHAKEYQ